MDLAKIPKKMPRKPKGAEKKLCYVTYSHIATWVGLGRRTVIECASRGMFDKRSLESILRWVNARRRGRGLPPVGELAESSGVDALENRTQSKGLEP